MSFVCLPYKYRGLIYCLFLVSWFCFCNFNFLLFSYYYYMNYIQKEYTAIILCTNVLHVGFYYGSAGCARFLTSYWFHLLCFPMLSPHHNSTAPHSLFVILFVAALLSILFIKPQLFLLYCLFSIRIFLRLLHFHFLNSSTQINIINKQQLINGLKLENIFIGNTKSSNITWIRQRL